MITVDVSGLKEFEAYLHRMADGFETFIREFLLKEALRVLRDTKRNTPVAVSYTHLEQVAERMHYSLRRITQLHGDILRRIK